ncbi:hypothetical protein ACRRTK_019376 [Alexandromys fortis]
MRTLVQKRAVPVAERCPGKRQCFHEQCFHGRLENGSPLGRSGRGYRGEAHGVKALKEETKTSSGFLEFRGNTHQVTLTERPHGIPLKPTMQATLHDSDLNQVHIDAQERRAKWMRKSCSESCKRTKQGLSLEAGWLFQRFAVIHNNLPDSAFPEFSSGYTAKLPGAAQEGDSCSPASTAFPCCSSSAAVIAGEDRGPGDDVHGPQRVGKTPAAQLLARGPVGRRGSGLHGGCFVDPSAGGSEGWGQGMIKVEEDFGFEADEALGSSWTSQRLDKRMPYATPASPPFD